MDNFIQNNKYPILGGGAGFILALLFLTLGFFKTIVLVLLTLAGALLAYYLQKSGLFEGLKK